MDPFAMIMQKVAMQDQNNRTLTAANTSRANAQTSAISDANVANIEARSGMTEGVMSNIDDLTANLGSEVFGEIIRQAAIGNGFNIGAGDSAAMRQKGLAFDRLEGMNQFGDAVDKIFNATGNLADKGGLLGDPAALLNMDSNPAFQRVQTGAQASASGSGNGNGRVRDNLYYAYDKKTNQPISGIVGQNYTEIATQLLQRGINPGDVNIGLGAQPRDTTGGVNTPAPVRPPAMFGDPVPNPAQPAPAAVPQGGAPVGNTGYNMVTKPDGSTVLVAPDGMEIPM